jgi:AAA15 family ATPase/GTPase
MLLSFSVANFRSFYDEQTLSMVASARQPDHPEHLSPIMNDDNKALPLAVLYGANGAGKSNLVKALRFLKTLVMKGAEPKKPIGRRPFVLNEKAADEPTEFRIQFQENGRVYAFGVKVNDRWILEEWLSIVQHGRDIPVYERVTRDDEEVVVEPGPVLLESKWGMHEKTLALTKVGSLPNQLFLSTVAKTLKSGDQGPILSDVLKWFTDRLVIILPDASFADLPGLLSKDTSFTKFAGDFLRSVATGVDGLIVETEDVEESLLAGQSDKMRELASNLSEGETHVITLNGGHQLVIEKREGTKLRIRKMKSQHLTSDGTTIVLPFSEESDGTQRLTHLLPALHFTTHDAPAVFVVDEIDRSLHPLLAKGFVRAFLSACVSRGSQLIFTTHELAFMDLELLRRDEIWFAAKNLPEGSTELYSLADYKVRTDLKIDKAYLQGRFEAIPPIETELPGWVQQIMQELKSSSGSTNAEGAA